jgi:hypothetical protein
MIQEVRYERNERSGVYVVAAPACLSMNDRRGHDLPAFYRPARLTLAVWPEKPLEIAVGALA